MERFSADALHKINEAAGFISASIHKLTRWASQWENEASLKACFGEGWNHAVITHGAEKFIVACWVYHYESWV